LTVPFLWYRSEGEFIFSDGIPGVLPQTFEVEEEEAGPADLLLEGKLKVGDQSRWLPVTYLTALWKVPTADEDKGLGTGESDLALGLETWKWLDRGERWLAFFDGYYNFIGDPDDRELDNRWFVEAGLGHATRPRWLNKIYYQVRTALSSDAEDAQSVYWETEVESALRCTTLAKLEIGISDGSPDFGVTLGAKRRF
jgi:hypothetical protein